jgi:ABC-2 type transport system ATP-binding protein
LESSEDTDIREDISRSIIERGFGLLSMNSIDMSLEDIFVQLVTEEKESS